LKKFNLAIAALLCLSSLTGCTDNTEYLRSDQTVAFVSNEQAEEFIHDVAVGCYGKMAKYEISWEGRPELNVKQTAKLKHLWKSTDFYVTFYDDITPSVELVNPYVSKSGGMTGIKISDNYWNPNECRIEIDGINPDVYGDYYATVKVYDGSDNMAEMDNVIVKVVPETFAGMPFDVGEIGEPYAAAEETTMPGDFVPSDDAAVVEDTENAETEEIVEEGDING